MAEFDVFLGLLIQPLRKEFDADIVSVTRIDEEPDWFIHYLTTAQTDAVERINTPRRGDTLAATVIRTGGPLRVADATTGPVGFPIMQAEGLHAYLGVPLMVDGVCVGAVEVMKTAACDWSAADETRVLEYAGMIQTVLAPVISTASTAPLHLH